MCWRNFSVFFSSVARAFPGGRVAHPESQNEEENEKSLRKNKKKWSKFGGKMRKVETLAHPGLWGWLWPWSFSLVTKKWVENSPFFSNGRHFKMCFPKMKAITFFRRKLSKLHKKDTILHVTITFFFWNKGKQE